MGAGVSQPISLGGFDWAVSRSSGWFNQLIPRLSRRSRAKFQGSPGRAGPRVSIPQQIPEVSSGRAPIDRQAGHTFPRERPDRLLGRERAGSNRLGIQVSKCQPLLEVRLSEEHILQEALEAKVKERLCYVYHCV